jgi:hypothetical protein
MDTIRLKIGQKSIPTRNFSVFYGAKQLSTCKLKHSAAE